MASQQGVAETQATQKNAFDHSVKVPLSAQCQSSEPTTEMQKASSRYGMQLSEAG